MHDRTLSTVTAEVEMLLEERLAAKGRTLKDKIRSAGRRLPRAVRRHLTVLAEAQSRYANPKMAGAYDARAVTEAYQHSVDWLEKIDLDERRRWKRSAWLAGTLVNLVLVAILFGLAVSALHVLN